MELSEKCALDIAAFVVGRTVRLQDLVEAFEHECPELLQWTVVEHEVARVRCIVVVRSDRVRTVQLVKDISVTTARGLRIY